MDNLNNLYFTAFIFCNIVEKYVYSKLEERDYHEDYNMNATNNISVPNTKKVASNNNG